MIGNFVVENLSYMNWKKPNNFVNDLASIYRSQVIIVLLLLVAPLMVKAQCPYNNANSGVTVNPVCPGTVSATSICAGQFINVNVTAGNIYTFYTCGATGWDTELTVFPNGGGLFIVEDDDGCTNTLQSSVSWLATFTGQVDVLLDDWPCEHIGGNCVSIFVECVLPPTNDEPCSAINLPMGATCNTMTASTFGTASSGIPAPGCAGYAGSDVWFTTVVPPSGNFIVETYAGGVTDAGMAIYSGGACPTPTPFTLIECDDFDGAGNMPLIYLTGQTPGTTLYIRVWEDGNNNNGTFDICAYEANPPPNDNPCGAIALTVGQTCGMATYTNALATGTVGPPTPTGCGTFNTGGYQGGDVWFTVEVPNTGVIDIEMGYGGVMNDAAMAVYSATACSGTFTQLACDDDSNGLFPALGFTGLTPGEILYVRVWGYNDNNPGTFDICAFGPIIPTGDCIYILNMNDSGGDGWNLSNVEVNLNGTSTYYTINGASGFAYIGVNLGDNIIVTYNPSGALGENEISYSLELNGSFIHSAGPTPPSGVVYSIDPVDCVQPPPTPQDCAGSSILCQTTGSFAMNPADIGTVNDLNAVNYGCLSSGERQGNWYLVSVTASGSLEVYFGGVGVDVDFAVWGPYPTVPTCIPGGSPIRCTSNTGTGYTGLASFAIDQYEGTTGGDGYLQNINVLSGEFYTIYVDNPNQSGDPVGVIWDLQGGADVSCTVLPVELLGFNVENMGSSNELNWRTATEEHSDIFELQRSFDAQEFTTISILDAAGNSQSIIEYSYVDHSPQQGVNYYRLKQVDQDGTFAYSDVISTVNRGNETSIEGPYLPNGYSTLEFDVWSPNSGDVQIDLFDLTGRNLLGETALYSSGGDRISLAIGDLATGAYLFRISDRRGEVLHTGKVFLAVE